FEFFRFAISGLVVNDTVPGHSRLWEEFQKERDSGGIEAIYSSTENLASAFQRSPGIGTPADFRAHVRSFTDAGVDQIILLQQAGRNRHEHICASLELLAAEVLPECKEEAGLRERRKAEELAPYIARALARKKVRVPLAEGDIPVVRASVAKPLVNRAAGQVFSHQSRTTPAFPLRNRPNSRGSRAKSRRETAARTWPGSPWGVGSRETLQEASDFGERKPVLADVENHAAK